jgi:hypothetical protein
MMDAILPQKRNEKMLITDKFVRRTQLQRLENEDSKESLDSKMLFDPLEKHFDLPARAV